MDLALPPIAGMPSRRARIRRDSDAFARRLRRWRGHLGRAGGAFNAAPLALRIAGIAAASVIILSVANFAYHAARKPAEMLSPLSGVLKKTPAETWRQYEPFFREYSTAAISPALLAALAQVEGGGNPVALTYWRWRWSWNPFALYEPASSAVGMYQMTDAAFAEARRYCIRDHLVVEDGCSPGGALSRLLPSRAIELAAVSLDRGVTALLPRRRAARASQGQKEELAAVLHLCGAGRASAFAAHGFRLASGERCGEHDVAAYLDRIRTLERQFRSLAAEG